MSRAGDHLIRRAPTEPAPERPTESTRAGADGGGPRARVVIVGAGFAGLAAVDELQQLEVDVTLVDRQGFHTFQPLLYQVATGGLNAGDIAYPARGTLRGHRQARFHLGSLRSVDWERRRVVLDDGGQVPYDYLVLAFGASTNFFGVPGAEEHAMPVYTIRQALRVRHTLFAALEHQAAHREQGLAHVVVVGGGATGVEMAGTLAEVRNSIVPEAFPELSVEDADVVLVEQNDHLLEGFHPRLQQYAARQLVERGVRLRLGEQVREVGGHRVVLASGEELDRAVTIWAAGVAVPEWVAELGLPRDRGGRLRVGKDLRVEGREEVFAVGDLAAAPVGEGLAPQLAQPALQGGRHAARQIGRLLEGLPTEPWHYRDKGIMATIGRKAAVVQLPAGLRMEGTLAWLAWLGLHIYFLMGRRNRLAVLANLAWRYLNWPRSTKVIVGD